MSDRIFVRRYLNPLDPPGIDLFRVGIGANVGNLVFASSAQRTLTVDGVDVETNNFSTLLPITDRLNDEGRHVVIPLANAFRRGYLRELGLLTEAIEKLTVPVTILGVGGQFGLIGPPRSAPDVDEAARRFLRAVLERGPSIGVRGERTAAWLHRLGFDDVDVIGCPSMFLRGRDLRLRDEPPVFDERTRLSLNLTPRVPIPAGWVEDLLARHPHTEFVGQQLSDLDAMLGGPAVPNASPGYPASYAHPLIAGNRAVFHQHAPTWIEAMAGRDFTVGHRIHGNIASLLAGTPAHVIVHDSRTLELCEYFQIPHTFVGRHTADLTPERFHAASDYSGMLAGHGERVDRFAAFMQRHGLRHALDLPAGEAPYDRQVAAVARRPDLVVRPRSTEPEIVDLRLWNTGRAVHESRTAEVAALRDRVAALERRLADLESPERSRRTRAFR